MKAEQFDLPGFTVKGRERFLKASQRIVNNLNQRMKARGVEARMSLEEGRRILALAVQKPCRYCGEPMKITTMTLDHRVPLARGGAPFAVDCICKRCNKRKGEMSAEGYASLRVFGATLTTEDRASLFGRLAAGGSFFRMRRALLAAKGEAAKVQDRVIAAVGLAPKGIE